MASTISNKNPSGVRLKKLWYGLFAFMFWTSVWYLLALAIGNELFLPYPHTVIVAWGRLLGQSFFWQAVGGSVLSIMAGFLLGTLFGTLLSLAAHRWELVAAIIQPMILVLRSTPVASFIILVYVLIRLADLPLISVSIVIVTVMVTPLFFNNLTEGYDTFRRDLAEVAAVYRFSFGKKIKVLWWPQLRPYVSAALTSSLGLAWKAGISAEVICSLKNTIGRYLADAKSNLDIDLLFAWTMTVILLSMLLEALFRRLSRGKKKTVFIHRKEQPHQEEDTV